MKKRTKKVSELDIYGLIERVEAIAKITGRKNHGYYFTNTYKHKEVSYNYSDVTAVIKNLINEIPYYSLASLQKAGNKTSSKVPSLLLNERFESHYIDEINRLEKIDTLLSIRSIMDSRMGYGVQNACDKKIDHIYTSKLKATNSKESLEKILKSIEKNLDPYDYNLKAYSFGSKKLVSIYLSEGKRKISSSELQYHINDIKNKIPNYLDAYLSENLFNDLSKRLKKINKVEQIAKLKNTNSLQEIQDIKQNANENSYLVITVLCELRMRRIFKNMISTVSDDNIYENLYPQCPVRLKKNFLMKWSQSINSNSESNIFIYLEFKSLFPYDKRKISVLKRQLVDYFEGKNNIVEICKVIDSVENTAITTDETVQSKTIESIRSASLDELRTHSKSLLVNCRGKKAALAFVDRLLCLGCLTKDIVEICENIDFSIKKLMEIDETIATTIALLCKQEIIQAVNPDELETLCEYISSCDNAATHRLKDLAIEKAHRMALGSI